MLLRQNLSRCHERNLISILNGDDRCLETHDRLARPDVSLQETTHGIKLFHIGGNLFQHPLLGGGGVKRKNLLDGRAHPIIELESDPGLRFQLPPLQFQSQLHKEQFVEDHSDMRRSSRRLEVREALARIRPMHIPQSGPRRDQS